MLTALTCYPKVSLIIPNLNGKPLLRECLTSLSELQYPDYEIIVVDGGSTDGSPQMVEREFPRVTIMREEGAGIGRSINLGAAKATGEILGFDLNNDEIFERDWLRKLVVVLLSSPDVGVVGGTRLVYGTKNLVDEGGYRYDFLGIPWSNIGLDRRSLPTTPQEVDSVGTPVVKHSLFERVGGCDEKYQLYYEDTDFCFKVKKNGFKVVWVPNALSYHRRSATIKSTLTPRVIFLITRNNLRFLLVHFEPLRLVFAMTYRVIVLPLLRVLFTSLTAFHTSKKTDGRLDFLYTPDLSTYLRLHLKAILWNLIQFKETLSKRREYQTLSQTFKKTAGRLITQ